MIYVLLVEQQDVQEIIVSDHSTCSLDFIVLHAKDPLITDLTMVFISLMIVACIKKVLSNLTKTTYI